MTDIVAAIAPIFCLIILGTVLRTLNFPGEAFWPLSARLAMLRDTRLHRKGRINQATLWLAAALGKL